MAGLTWILTFICAAGAHLTSASPVLQPPLVVEARQNVSLTCNLSLVTEVTGVTEVTWFLLRSDQLLPLMRVLCGKLGRETVDFYPSNSSRFYKVGALESGTVGLGILQVEEEDAGMYFCIWKGEGASLGSRSFQLAVGGVNEETAGQPCLHLSVFILLAVLLLCVIIIIVGFYLSSGKPAVCRCGSVRSDVGLKVTEDESLHYSSLKHADRLRPSGHGGTGLVEDAVLYSTVKNLNAARSRS